jgi:acyl carrier protein
MDPKAEIRQLIRTLLEQRGDYEAFADASSLLLSGRLSSIDTVEIVVLLEQKFGIDFSEIGFDQTMLDTVDSICALITSEAAHQTR